MSGARPNERSDEAIVVRTRGGVPGKPGVQVSDLSGVPVVAERLKVFRKAVVDGGVQRMRQKLRSPAGQRQYQRRKQLVESVIGSLKEHGGMRQFQRRGLVKVAVEFTLAAIAFNLKRWHRVRRP